jgi:hypothetical protein
MLGVGALLQPKARADDHWSASPKVVLEFEATHVNGGEPGLDLPPSSSDPFRPGAARRRRHRRRSWFRRRSA